MATCSCSLAGTFPIADEPDFDNPYASLTSSVGAHSPDPPASDRDDAIDVTLTKYVGRSSNPHFPYTAGDFVFASGPAKIGPVGGEVTVDVACTILNKLLPSDGEGAVSDPESQCTVAFYFSGQVVEPRQRAFVLKVGTYDPKVCLQLCGAVSSTLTYIVFHCSAALLFTLTSAATWSLALAGPTHPSPS